MNKNDLIYLANCQKAKRNLWHYCKVKAPDFYKDSRKFQKEMADALQEFLYNDEKVLIINLPPRHGKSRTACNFVEWALGNNPQLKIMTGSYNQVLSTQFSTNVRNSILQEKTDDKIIFRDIFPNVSMSYGSAAKNLWKLENSSVNNYLATSPKGSATGMGADIILIDDLIKSEYEARNEQTLSSQWEWFVNTMLSRLEGLRKIILIMTRWGKKDLAGRCKKHFEDLGVKVRNVVFKALEKGKMLCDEILPKSEYDILRSTLGKDIFEANYNQVPIDVKGRLYTNLMEYDDLPNDIIGIDMYTDTADEGDDYLASIVYAYNLKKEIYVIDIIFTKAPMEETEPIIASKLLEHKVNYCIVESNNGGKGFARNVKRITQELGNVHTVVKWFHQSNNKKSRILTNATGVMNTVRFPKNWKEKYKDAYDSIYEYQREGKNKHDDIQDAITGMYEKVSAKKY